MSIRFNAYQIMWLFVSFDLPTETKAQRKAAAQFRKNLLQDGFTMFQFSIYIRHCMSRENADVHLGRVERMLPLEGHVMVHEITDKQFSKIHIFHGGTEQDPPKAGDQLLLF